MATRLFGVASPEMPGGRHGLRVLVIGVAALILFLIGNPLTVIPAGHVGVKDLFGKVSPGVLTPGVNFVIPFTRVVKFSVQTQELKETADVPSREGLIMDLEASLLYRLDPSKAALMYKTVGSDYASRVVEPQIRAAIREITASYDAKALYSAQREKIALEIFTLFNQMSLPRGIIADAVLLRKIGLPAVVANAIQEKLKREQEAEQMKFVLQKESQEAERKRIEAQGISDFQKIVAAGISPQLLEWKGIEATEKLAMSSNTKVVVIGNPKSGLPIILGNDTTK
ncbi:MAG: prohibitin family protein [Acidobacteria bacterium]|nr:prohibitin family protein [Acidobacteriota bacterium]MCA1610629.1 prohibitin family protein [Acidobacteriota bacterium]